MNEYSPKAFEAFGSESRSYVSGRKFFLSVGEIAFDVEVFFFLLEAVMLLAVASLSSALTGWLSSSSSDAWLCIFFS